MLNVWLCQSHFSFLQAASSPAELVEMAWELGHSGLASTDFDGSYGIARFFAAHRQHLKDDTKPKPDCSQKIFYGTQLLLRFEMDTEAPLIQPNGIPYVGDQTAPVWLQNRVVFIATNKQSYAQIQTLITYTHAQGKQSTPINLSDPLVPWPSGCIVILPGRGVSQLFHGKGTPLFSRWISFLNRIRECNIAANGPNVESHFYLAVTPPSSPLEHNAYSNHLDAHEILKIPLLATSDVFFHTPQRKIIHDVLTSVRMNQSQHDCEWAQFVNSERHFTNTAYLQKFCARSQRLKDALSNNQRLSDKIQFCLSEICYVYPNEFIPRGYTAQGYLEHILAEAFQKIVHAKKDVIWDVIQKELSLIRQLKYADYFLTVWDIVRFARSQNILCQGRGSAANSAVCYLLEITALDPTECDLLFERFMSVERGEPPDIDVDFEHERREEVIQYIYQRYGRLRAAMVANVITFQRKGAMRSVGKAMGFNETQLTKIVSPFQDHISRRHMSAKELLEKGFESLDAAHFSAEQKVEIQTKWLALAHVLRGFPRHLGIHSGGFVVSQENLNTVCATEPATMPGRSVLQWNKDDIEALGLFKIDVLSLGMLTAIRKTLEYLKEHNKKIPGTLIPLSYYNVPMNCDRTYTMIRAAKTVGVFQIESRAQMSMLPRLQPKTFYDLVIQLAIVRPGPITGGMVHPYLKRRMGQEKAVYPDPRLRPILERTLGIPIFQEQVMRIAMAVGGFTAGESDELRRSMGAWKFKGNLDHFRARFTSGMTNNKIPESFINQILAQIEGFSEYGFPESHAASFAIITYISCYLKSNYHVYFLCGLLNSQPLGFYSIHSLLQDAKLSHISILQPCVMRSRWDSFVNNDGSLQLGFRLIAILRAETIHTYILLRTQHAATKGSLNFGELVEMTKVLSSAECIALVMSNSMRCFSENRRDLLWYFIARPALLFHDVEWHSFEQEDAVQNRLADMQDDFHNLQTTFGPHPMEIVKQAGWPFDMAIKSVTLSKNLGMVPNDTVVIVCGLSVCRQSPPTAKGIVFISLEDETGTINAVIRPNVYKAFQDTLRCGDIQCFRGKTQRNGTQSTILVSHVFPYMVPKVVNKISSAIKPALDKE